MAMGTYLSGVVYRTIPTSNHNSQMLFAFSKVLYIVLFLHQTTTFHSVYAKCRGCISYYSYIKPQLDSEARLAALRCISYYSYIKPQLGSLFPGAGNGCISYYSYIKPQPTASASENAQVVYRTIPTSNHN